MKDDMYDVKQSTESKNQGSYCGGGSCTFAVAELALLLSSSNAFWKAAIDRCRGEALGAAAVAATAAAASELLTPAPPCAEEAWLACQDDNVAVS